MDHTSIYDVMNQLLDPRLQYDDPAEMLGRKESKKKKSLHDYERNGSIIEYMDEDMDILYYAISFDDRYIPLKKGAAPLKSDNQIVSVYDYPVDNLNEAFWNQKIDFGKAKLVWSRDFADEEKKLKELDRKIRKLQAERERYARRIPKSYLMYKAVKEA